MPELKTVNTQTKNSMPTFVETTYKNLIRGLNDNIVAPPIFGFLLDLECMVFVDSKRNIHKILVDRLIEVEHQLDGLKDPETGEPIKVVEYVTDTVAPVQEQVQIVDEAVQDIRKNGATIMITVPEDGGDE